MSARLSPDTSTSTGRRLLAPRITSDFTIAPSSQPTAAAASGAVRVESASRWMSAGSPSSISAACTRRAPRGRASASRHPNHRSLRAHVDRPRRGRRQPRRHRPPARLLRRAHRPLLPPRDRPRRRSTSPSRSSRAPASPPSSSSAPPTASPPAASASTPTGELTRVFVIPEFRRGGGGRALLAAAESTARTRGLTRLFLDTRHDLVEARALYTASGFTEVPPFSAPGPFKDHWFEKHLPT